MGIQRRGGTCDNHTPAPVIDLTALTNLLNDILVQVKDHNNTVALDLTPIVSKLAQIIDALAHLELTVGLTTSSVDHLTQLFLTELTKIENFSSEEVLVLQAIQQSNLKLDTDISAILNEMSRLKTIDRLIFDYNYVVGNTPATILIPAGAVELNVLTGCYDYKATIGKLETWIDAGDDICVEFRNTAAGVLSEPSYLLELPANAKCHINYTALSDIGAPVLTGAVTLFAGKFEIDKNAVALQAAIDVAKKITAD